MANRPPLPSGVNPKGMWVCTASAQVSLTDDRTTLTIQRFGGPQQGTTVFALSEISGIQIDKPHFGQLLGRFRVLVPGTVAPPRGQSGMQAAADPFVVLFPKRQLHMFENVAKAVTEAKARPAPQPAAGPAAPGLADQLAQLADLHASRALSDAEFAAAKARLLGSQPGPHDAPPGGERAW